MISVFCRADERPTIDKYGKLDIIETGRDGKFGRKMAHYSLDLFFFLCVTIMMMENGLM